MKNENAILGKASAELEARKDRSAWGKGVSGTSCRFASRRSGKIPANTSNQEV